MVFDMPPSARTPTSVLTPASLTFELPQAHLSGKEILRQAPLHWVSGVSAGTLWGRRSQLASVYACL